MSTRSPLPILVAAVLATLLAYAAVTPFFAFGALLNAAAAHDDVLLARQVDYAALRANLALELRDETVAKLERIEPSLGFLAGVVAGAASGAVAEALATPAGLRALLGVGPLRPEDVAEIRALHDRARRGYRAWDRFEVRAPSPLLGADVTYAFERRLLGWRLTGVRF